MNIVEIRISCHAEFTRYAYVDRLALTDHSIEYVCEPDEPYILNPIQKWSYISNSPAFKKLFESAGDAVHEILERDLQCRGTDIPTTSFYIRYSDGKTVENSHMLFSDEFSECYNIIKKMVPPCELMPWVLQTSWDYGKRRLWHDVLSYDCLREALWDLKLFNKTDIRCPVCGNELFLSCRSDGFPTVFCKTDGCLSIDEEQIDLLPHSEKD